MHLEDLKVMNRFEIMNNLETGKDRIENHELSEAIKVLNQREIGIPKELLFQEYEYRAAQLGTGLKGYFIGTQPAWKCIVVFVALTALFLLINFALSGENSFLAVFEALVLGASAYSVFVCSNNTKTNIMYILALLLVAQFVLRTMFAAFIFLVPYIL